MFNQHIISIVLPVYNGQKYIKFALDSILDQTETNWELIIVNDGSTDNTLNIISEFQRYDDRVKIINNPENKNLPESLNIGFRQAKGRYYTWVSSDNILKPTFLKTLSSILDSNPDIDLVYSDYDTIDEKGHLMNRVSVEPPSNIPIHNVVGASFMYRSDTAKRIGEYNPKLYLIEDYDYWVRFYLQAKIASVSESLLFYRLHNNSLTARFETKIIEIIRKYKKEKNDILLPQIKGEDIRLKYYAYLRMYGVNCEKTSEALLMIRHPRCIKHYLFAYSQRFRWKLKHMYFMCGSKRLYIVEQTKR